MWIIPTNYPQSSRYAQDMVGSSEDLALPDINIEQSLMWRQKPSQLRTWSQRWKRDSWFRHLSGRILKPCQRTAFETELKSSLAVIPASRLAQQESAQEKKTPDTYGPTSKNTFEQFDLFDASSRTSKDTLALDCEKSLATWKALVTQQRGEYSARLKSARRIRESESSLWPTPTTDSASSRSKKYSQGGTPLSMAVQTWLTPLVQDSKHSGTNSGPNGKRNLLVNQVNWATPRASDANGGARPLNDKGQRISKSNPTSIFGAQLSDQAKHYPTPRAEEFFPTPTTTEARSDTLNLVNRASKGKQIMLTHHVRIYPTPSTRDWKDSPGMAKTAINPDGSKRKRNDQLARAIYATENPISGHLNPDWVEWLMGVPTGWTDLGSWATALCQPQQPKRGEC